MQALLLTHAKQVNKLTGKFLGREDGTQVVGR